MKLHNVAISVIIVSMIVLGLIGWITDLGDTHGTIANMSSLDNTQVKLEKQQNLSKELNKKMNFTLDTGDVAGFLVPYKLIQIAWGSVRLVFNSWSTIVTMMGETVSGVSSLGLPIPGWFLPSIIAIFIILLVVMIIYGFFKWKFEL